LYWQDDRDSFFLLQHAQRIELGSLADGIDSAIDKLAFVKSRFHSLQ
jgi:hypothetical protein